MPRSGEDSRRRLQKAAFDLFEERGYDQTTAAEIAARAGVTERTFFRHFPDKKEVLFAGEAAFRATLTAAVAAAPSAASPLEALLFGFRAVAADLEAYRPYSATRRKVVAGAPALRERELAKAAAMIDDLTQALRRRGVEAEHAALASHVGAAAFFYASAAWADDAPASLHAHLDRTFEQMRLLAAQAPG